MMSKIEEFAKLHIPGTPLILFNIWDPGSAKAVSGAGAKAIATGSWGVACAAGYADGEKLPLDFAIDNLKRIQLVTDLPVTIDMEAGYGATDDEVGRSVTRAAAAGAVGINMEDKDPFTRVLFPVEQAASRVAAAAATGLFVNARIDVFILTPAADHDAKLVDQAVERAKAYADSGARGVFAPFLRDETLIARLCEKSPLPVNILMGEGIPNHGRLAELGVARISHGHGPWAAAMDWLAAEARKIYSL
jgi:2-methylisocitrate lyase-like PEP mutase family enzyme